MSAEEQEADRLGQLKEQQAQGSGDTVKDRVARYWSERSEGFLEMKHHEAHSYKADLWREELTASLPGENPLCILDAGCGAGFFALVLAPLGHYVTGIDLTPEMITGAKNLAERHGAERAEFLLMDAEHTDFPDECFDAVISRNLTWTLPNPEAAYAEWYRVLKPGGMLLNYDAEYAKGFHEYDQNENLAHKSVEPALIEECHKIYHMLDVSIYDRPAWDETILRRTGFREIETDRSAGDRLYRAKDEFYMPDRMFRIRAVK